MTPEQKIRRRLLDCVISITILLLGASGEVKTQGKKETNRKEKSPVVNEEKLKMDLARIMEYPPPDRIKRLRFFLRSNPRSALVPQATEALNAALVENGEAPSPSENTAPKVEESKPDEEAAATTVTTTTTTAAPAPPPENEAAKKIADEAQPTAPLAVTATSTTPAPTTETPAAEPPIRTTGSNARGKNSSQLERILAQPLDARISKLRAFLRDNPAASPANITATEALIAALAESGDEKLKSGAAADGVGQFRAALELLPANISDKLFSGVVAQIPTNLYVRGEAGAALEAARAIETKISDSAPRLLVLASFYLSLEQADDAARLAGQAVTLAPESAAAHQALGAAHHVALRLDDAALEYARAVELDAKLGGARRSLADLRRATGKPDEALALYRELLTVEPKDLAARAGMILALFEAGKKEEAEGELTAALGEEPRNLPLVVGAAYWYAAQGDGERAVEYARRAVAIEPRYTWAQIALARALLLQKRPAEAESALRTAKQYGRFSTLDYELANALAAGGFYDEAAGELARSFAWGKDGVTTRLAGRREASAPDFVELLAPERRASLFQVRPAETESNARMLRGLLALRTLTEAPGGGEGAATVRETAAADAAREFVTYGDEATRALRQLYAGELLLSKNIALPAVLELAEGATAGVEAALDAPSATAALLAGEVRDWRARAVAANSSPSVPALPRDVLSKIMRGRLEALAGWAYFNLDKPAEAVVRLRRAAGVLPENSLWWRTSSWRLGAALDANDNREEALAAYIKSYQSGAPDAGRRAVIEALYRKINGSLNGLNEKLGAPPARDSGSNSPAASGTGAAAASAGPAAPPSAPEANQP